MKTIKLKAMGIGRYDDVSPFIITDNRLSLKIELPAVNGEFYFIAENNGVTIKRLLPSDGKLTLEELSAGELLAEVKHYLKGELIKTYKIEPLILKEVDGKLSADPEIVAVSRETERLRQELSEERGRAAKREEEFNEYKRAAAEREAKLAVNLTALMYFACADYLNNVYLGGESVEDFIKQFGFVLTEEQKEKLKEGVLNED